MAYAEHLGDNKYRIGTRDPNSLTKKKIYSPSFEVPEKIMKNEKKLEAHLLLKTAEFQQKVDDGDTVSVKKMTVEKFIPLWKKGCAKKVMGGYTIKNTVAVINCHMLPTFGHIQLDRIEPIHLFNFFSNLVRKKDGMDMATNTKLNIYKAYKSVFDAAFKLKLIKKNPICGIERPSIQKKEKKAMKQVKKKYTMDEVITVLNALYALEERWRLYFTGLMIGGPRRGEYFAVEWPRCDFIKDAIFLDEQITFDEDGKVISGELKTEESEDWIPMPHWYMEDLKAYRKVWVKEKLNCVEWKGGEKQYIFHRGDGLPYYPTTATVKWRRFLEDNNLPHLKLHGLRHTCGNLLREFGSDIQTVQEQLRHAKLETTDGYMHKDVAINRTAMDRLESLDPKKFQSAPQSAPNAN